MIFCQDCSQVVAVSNCVQLFIGNAVRWSGSHILEQKFFWLERSIESLHPKSKQVLLEARFQWKCWVNVLFCLLCYGSFTVQHDSIGVVLYM